MRSNRRTFLTAAAAAILAGSSRVLSAAGEVPVSTEQQVDWRNVKDWGVEGKGWTETERDYDRLPARAKESVRDAVWNLSRHSAGMLVRFRTNSPAIQVRYQLLSPQLDMPHMPATGVSGVDLYAGDAAGGESWLAVSRPAGQQVTAVLAADVDSLPQQALRSYTLYLPLYNGVESLQIGVVRDARFAPTPPRSEPKPLVFYGTSIMQGACASRPGMSITAILGRRLQRPTINLGFSGNGRLEQSVGKLIAELEASVYVIDCLPNLYAAQVAQRAAPLVRQLRQARPETPILLVEDRTYTNARFQQASRARHQASRAALRAAYDQLQRDQLPDVHYLAGDGLLGSDGEAATDGSHPNDLGMMRYADAYEPALRRILDPS